MYKTITKLDGNPKEKSQNCFKAIPLLLLTQFAFLKDGGEYYCSNINSHIIVSRLHHCSYKHSNHFFSKAYGFKPS